MKEKKEGTAYDVSMGDMIYASQSNPSYFADGVIHYTEKDGRSGKGSFFGGNVIAESPSMYAVILATEHKGIDPSQINLISVGGISQRSNQIT